jgi:hypothetical protein
MIGGSVDMIKRLMFFLKGKKILWTKYVRIFCDSGYKDVKYRPKIITGIYSNYWGIKGFIIDFLGREFWFSFGEDKHGLYK